MQLQMIARGILAGFGVLLALAVLQWLATREAVQAAVSGAEADISEQVWQVLAEARRIVEESA